MDLGKSRGRETSSLPELAQTTRFVRRWDEEDAKDVSITHEISFVARARLMQCARRLGTLFRRDIATGMAGRLAQWYVQIDGRCGIVLRHGGNVGQPSQSILQPCDRERNNDRNHDSQRIAGLIHIRKRRSSG